MFAYTSKTLVAFFRKSGEATRRAKSDPTGICGKPWNSATNYLFAPTHTVTIESLKGENMLIDLSQAQKMSQLLQRSF
jgi:hypothetical protein